MSEKHQLPKPNKDCNCRLCKTTHEIQRLCKLLPEFDGKTLEQIYDGLFEESAEQDMQIAHLEDQLKEAQNPWRPIDRLDGLPESGDIELASECLPRLSLHDAEYVRSKKAFHKGYTHWRLHFPPEKLKEGWERCVEDFGKSKLPKFNGHQHVIKFALEWQKEHSGK